ncbi:hypothetical protein KBD75_01055 [Candidatus Woesebacteria bacterium]|nr:hypothetical protein [Candidatus Woesebacteria bacterium]
MAGIIKDASEFGVEFNVGRTILSNKLTLLINHIDLLLASGQTDEANAEMVKAGLDGIASQTRGLYQRHGAVVPDIFLTDKS